MECGVSEAEKGAEVGTSSCQSGEKRRKTAGKAGLDGSSSLGWQVAGRGGGIVAVIVAVVVEVEEC